MMQTQAPLFSVIIPVYNYAHTVRQAVHSVLKQLADIEAEIILIDDGSRDNSAEICDSLAKQYSCIRFVTQENGGAASARNHGIQLAKGQYLVFLDADDELNEGALSAVAAAIHQHRPEVIIGGHTACHEDGKQKRYLPGHIPDTAEKKIRAYLIDKKIRISNGAIFIHKTVFTRGLFPEQFRNGEDLPVFAQALCHDRVISLNDSLVMVNKHPDSLRHQSEPAIQAGIALVDEIFNEQRLPKEALVWRDRYVAQRALSIMRILYRSGQYQEALSVYRRALSSYPFAIFRWSYTRKALWAFFRQLFP